MGGWEGGWITFLGRLTVWDLQNVLEFSILIEIFENSTIFLAFRYLYIFNYLYSIKTLKFSRQFGRQGQDYD